MVGCRALAQVQDTPQPSPLPVCRTKNHTPHSCLYESRGTHDARLQGHQQGAIIKSPISPQGSSLPQGHQFPMAKGIPIPLTPVGSPANAAPAIIENDRSHGNLSSLAHHGRPAQQAPHPQGGEIVIQA